MTQRRRDAERAWLRDELPELTAAGVLDEPAAERLRAHYRLDELSPGVNRTLVAFAVMGGGLIGAGIILLVAHNWDAMSRLSRAGLCVALLLLAQGLCGYALRRPRAAEAWREASALFLTASLGASLSLVSQTYDAQGELGDLLLAWVALMVPVVYLLEARVSAMVLLFLALGLPLGRDHALDEGYAFLGALAALAPFVVRASVAYPGARRTTWLELSFAASTSIGLGLLVARDAPSVMALGLLLLFVLARLVAARVENALLGDLAAIAIGFLSLMLTFEDAIEDLGGGHGELAFTTAAAVGTAAALVWLLRMADAPRRDERAFVAALAPAWVAFGLGSVHGAPAIGALLFDVYVFALGLERLLGGLRMGHRKRSNFGLLLLSGLFLARFFDSELSFLQRGFGMMTVGAAFLAVNVHLGRREGERSAGATRPARGEGSR